MRSTGPQWIDGRMRVSRIHLALRLAEGQELDLTEERAHYILDVLRLRRGEALTVFNGEGGEYAATVSSAERKRVRIRVGAYRMARRESRLQVHLGLGISRGERMDLAIQKSVELGVAAITPIEAGRSVVKLDAERRVARRTHWQKIARSAAEQCHRTRVPEVAEPVSLDTWLAAGHGLRLMLDPAASENIRELPDPGTSLQLLSGPEGGFSADERARALDSGYRAIRLGPRVLRTETAAIAALAAVQLLWGDLGD